LTGEFDGLGFPGERTFGTNQWNDFDRGETSFGKDTKSLYSLTGHRYDGRSLFAHAAREVGVQSSHQKVLIVDDDPMHLEIYCMLIKQAGFEPLPALVKFTGTELPRDQAVELVLLDYRLNSFKTSPEFAKEIRSLYPSAPIVVLSDLWSLPTDIAPFVDGFVRKGEPDTLLETILRFLAGTSEPEARSNETVTPQEPFKQ
jgi:CheY-like chemotaxis protein